MPTNWLDAMAMIGDLESQLAERDAEIATAEAELAKPRCEHGCGQIVDHTLVCGAPQCCEACCKLQKAEAERDAAEKARSILGYMRGDESAGDEYARIERDLAELTTLRARVEELEYQYLPVEVEGERWWSCLIGPAKPGELPPGCDSPMRNAVADAFCKITGHDDQFLSSGWGAHPDKLMRKIMEPTPDAGEAT